MTDDDDERGQVAVTSSPPQRGTEAAFHCSREWRNRGWRCATDKYQIGLVRRAGYKASRQTGVWAGWMVEAFAESPAQPWWWRRCCNCGRCHPPRQGTALGAASVTPTPKKMASTSKRSSLNIGPPIGPPIGHPAFPAPDGRHASSIYDI